MLKVRNLAFGHGSKPLYEKVNFSVGSGQKIGLVGPNGSGKSTLLSIITGKETGFTGEVEAKGNIVLVPQEIKYDPIMEAAETVRDYVDPDNKFLDFEINKMFSGIELAVSLAKNPKSLSGGQKTKLALARALLLNPDILLLDEPTNFMDTAGKKWVMNFLSEYEGSVIVISHDLELMNNAIDKVLAIAPYSSEIVEYKGNYKDYERLKSDHERKLKKELLIKERHLKRMEKDYARMGKYDPKRTVRRRQIEREKLALPEIPPELKRISIRLPEPKRVGELPIRALGISKKFGDKQILRDINFTILRDERIALIGANGKGKSTFIKILMEMLPPDSGQVIRDYKLSVGYYSQEFETFDFSKSPLEVFCEETGRDRGFARAFLGRFMFSGDKVFQTISSLSGGEKTRLAIAVLTGKDHNLLILDEPTTYLDVMSQRVILESLKEYKGTLIIVSHTPEFIKELKPVKAFLFPEEKMVFWEDGLLDKVAVL